MVDVSITLIVSHFFLSRHRSVLLLPFATKCFISPRAVRRAVILPLILVREAVQFVTKVYVIPVPKSVLYIVRWHHTTLKSR